MFRLILFTTLMIVCSNCVNILVIMPSPLYSHQAAFRGLWEKLASRGHNITVVTTEPENHERLPNLNKISLLESRNIWKKVFKEETREEVSFWKVNDMFYRIGEAVTSYQLAQPNIQNLIHKKDNLHFDLVMVEVFYPEFLAFGKIYNAPTILLATLGCTIATYQRFGNPVHPALNPGLNVPFAGSLTFKERLFSTLHQLYHMLSEHFIVLPRKQKIIDKYFGDVVNTEINDLLKNVDLMLLNGNHILDSPRALGPNIINVGGSNLLQPLKPLSKDLQEFLDSSENGFIYFSLGSIIKSKELSNNTLLNIMKAFEQIPFKVVWKFESSLSLNVIETVKLVKWAPQQDILRHPNIKAFITQCGIHSIEEAVLAQVPIIAMPFFGDQLKNARIVENKNIGKQIYHKPALSYKDLRDAIMEVTHNEKYKSSIRKLASLLGDEPMSGLEKAVWWTEYVIRNRGAKELRNPASDIPLYQFYLLDILGFIFFTSFLFCYIINKLFSKFQQYFMRRWKNWNDPKLKTH
ncbi:UDP-glucosyltransferase 2 [Leptinotarsa decemlineata]|uniref:UDP-glucosyltransferase 2 n=1 Tax=Leptinotarsa decemlineata TaxID=7539 RepID=UPI003D3044BF